ncbi:MAG: iron-containing redox enzyme family protein [Gammaproteobacteria bacterium]
MQNSAQFNLKRHLVSARLRAASQQLWSHPNIVQLYPIMLFRIHCMARATVPLMEAAIEQLRNRPTEPVTADLIDYFTRQIPQETGHDGWLLEDLEALGIARQDTLTRMPPPTVAALIGAQYYWIKHHHPIALLGYIAVVESETPTLEHIEQTVQRTGLPKEAFRNFSRHAILEPSHNQALDRLFDTLPLSPEQTGLIGVSITQSANMIAQAAEEILEFHALTQSAASPSTPATITAAV